MSIIEIEISVPKLVHQRYINIMILVTDHILLWTAFFLFGLGLGFFITYVLIQSGGKRL